MAQTLGHYGLPAILLAGCGLAALVIHFAVPYQVTWMDGDTEAEKRSEVADTADLLGDAWVSGAGPGLTLAGAITLLVAGAALVGLGFAPMAVDPARWVGWVLGAAALVGAALVFVSSMFWVGDWVASLLNLGNDSGPDFTLLLSPLILAILGGLACWQGLALQRSVAPAPEREAMRGHHRIALLGLAFAGTVLLVPWAFDPDHSAGGFLFGGGFDDNGGYAWYSAHTVLFFGSVDSSLWDGLEYSLLVMLATGWTLFGLGVLAGLSGLLASTQMGVLARRAGLAYGAALFMLAWSAVLYVLCWVLYFKPDDDIEGFHPGYFPALLLLPFVLAAIGSWSLFREGLDDLRAGGGSRAPMKKVRFE